MIFATHKATNKFYESLSWVSLFYWYHLKKTLMKISRILAKFHQGLSKAAYGSFLFLSGQGGSQGRALEGLGESSHQMVSGDVKGRPRKSKDL